MRTWRPFCRTGTIRAPTGGPRRTASSSRARRLPTLESALYLLELGVAPEHEALRGVAQLIFDAWREDGRIRTAPGDLYPLPHRAGGQRAVPHGVRAGCAAAADAGLFSGPPSGPTGAGAAKSTALAMVRRRSIPRPIPLWLFSICSARFPALRMIPGWTARWISCCRTGRFRRPISPCHYGIGSRFMQVEYPMRGYGLFYYVYVLSFYERARGDKRFSGSAVRAGLQNSKRGDLCHNVK